MGNLTASRHDINHYLGRASLDRRPHRLARFWHLPTGRAVHWGRRTRPRAEEDHVMFTRSRLTALACMAALLTSLTACTSGGAGGEVHEDVYIGADLELT